MQHSEKSIIEILNKKYLKKVKFRVSNIFIFKDDWESDFFLIQRESKYCYEFEIKISRADFFNDFKKKDKHSILEKGTYSVTSKKYNRKLKIYETNVEDKPWNFRPNKFYYCVPELLIKPEEVPDYAGLIYVTDNDIYTVKEAKFLHKEKLDFDKKLCTKFYYWLNCLEVVKKLNKKIEKLEKNVRK